MRSRGSCERQTIAIGTAHMNAWARLRLWPAGQREDQNRMCDACAEWGTRCRSCREADHIADIAALCAVVDAALALDTSDVRTVLWLDETVRAVRDQKDGPRS
jgi:hypothetical protein